MHNRCAALRFLLTENGFRKDQVHYLYDEANAIESILKQFPSHFEDKKGREMLSNVFKCVFIESDQGGTVAVDRSFDSALPSRPTAR